MSYLFWQHDANTAIGSARLVLRADEVPLLLQAQQLRDELDALRRSEDERIDAACATARDEGRAAGLAQGRAEGRDELAAALVLLARAAEDERAQQRRDVAALALQVARKLIGSLAADARLASLAETAAHEVLPGATMTLRIHPDRCDAVRQRLARDGAPAFDVRADADAGLDDCVIETDLGRVEVSLDAQLARLAAAWGVQ